MNFKVILLLIISVFLFGCVSECPSEEDAINNSLNSPLFGLPYEFGGYEFVPGSVLSFSDLGSECMFHDVYDSQKILMSEQGGDYESYLFKYTKDPEFCKHPKFFVRDFQGDYITKEKATGHSCYETIVDGGALILFNFDRELADITDALGLELNQFYQTEYSMNQKRGILDQLFRMYDSQENINLWVHADASEIGRMHYNKTLVENSSLEAICSSDEGYCEFYTIRNHQKEEETINGITVHFISFIKEEEYSGERQTLMAFWDDGQTAFSTGGGSIKKMNYRDLSIENPNYNPTEGFEEFKEIVRELIEAGS